MGPRCAPTLILDILQPSNSQSEKPILKSSWHLTERRYYAFFFIKQDRKDGGIPRNFGDFPFFDFQHSKLGIPFISRQRYYMTPPDCATIRSVGPVADNSKGLSFLSGSSMTVTGRGSTQYSIPCFFLLFKASQYNMFFQPSFN